MEALDGSDQQPMQPDDSDSDGEGNEGNEMPNKRLAKDLAKKKMKLEQASQDRRKYIDNLAGIGALKEGNTLNYDNNLIS